MPASPTQTPQTLPPSKPLASKPQPSQDREPSGIAADDAGATSIAERVAREADLDQIDANEKAELGAEASRDEDA